MPNRLNNLILEKCYASTEQFRWDNRHYYSLSQSEIGGGMEISQHLSDRKAPTTFQTCPCTAVQ